jgi:hypothetical protein
MNPTVCSTSLANVLPAVRLVWILIGVYITALLSDIRQPVPTRTTYLSFQASQPEHVKKHIPRTALVLRYLVHTLPPKYVYLLPEYININICYLVPPRDLPRDYPRTYMYRN